jgi:uroporphyrinogen-III decarboxylase
MGGVYVTLFSGLIEIYGWDAFLMAAATDEERFGRVVDGYFRWALQFFEAYAESSVPVIMSHDDLCWTSGPVFHPAWYRKWIFPYIKRLWAPLREAGKLIMFTSDGNWTEFFDDIVDCGADHVVMEPCADMARFADRHGARVGFTGNADTRILLMGSRDEIEAEVRRCMDIGKRCPGYVMAVGNHIPQNTPVESALWYDECYRRLSRR